MRRITVTAVALSAFLPTLVPAQAWTPYGGVSRVADDAWRGGFR